MMLTSNLCSIGIVIPTYQAEKHLSLCLQPWIDCQLKPRILVVDSSSTDNTVEIARKMGVETIVIAQNEFNHGLTREYARHYLNTDIVVMVTQDAYAENDLVLEKLIAPIIAKQAAVSYARQIPHKGANFFESFSREFNYPLDSQLRGLEDIEKYGVYTFFCSDSCAAYDNRLLNQVGGFSSVLFGEDTLVVSKLLQAGHRIAYTPEAVVSHSHSYSLSQEFRRNFDIGFSRQEYRHLLAVAGKDSGRGLLYTKTLLSRIVHTKPSLLPYAVMQTLCKWLGYKIGSKSLLAPLWFKKCLSSQKFYWISKAYKNKV